MNVEGCWSHSVRVRWPEDASVHKGAADLSFDSFAESLYFQGASTPADLRVEGIDSPLLVDVSPWLRSTALKVGSPLQFHVAQQELREFEA